MFDRHWWIKRNISEEDLRRTRIIDPEVRPRKKRKGFHNLRIPSSFEVADLNHPASRQPREYPEPPPPRLPGLNPTPPVPTSQPFVQNEERYHPEASQPSSAVNAQVQGLSTTAQVRDSSPAYTRIVTTPSMSEPNTTVNSSVTHITLQTGQRQLQPHQPRLPICQNYSSEPSSYAQQPQYPLWHHPQPAIHQPYHSFSLPAPIQNSFAPSQHPAQLVPQQWQYLTPSPHASTPQNADFVQPFLPGRAHHYVAYTSEDTTSSQFR
jgi:hypothetical protein